jgi:arsenate reductase
MREVGIDLSSKSTQSVFDLYKKGRLYNYVITVCDGTNAQRCPLFPGISVRQNWSFEDPAGFTGTYEDRLEKTREIRDHIKRDVEKFIAEVEKGEAPGLFTT